MRSASVYGTFGWPAICALGAVLAASAILTWAAIFRCDSRRTPRGNLTLFHEQAGDTTP
ncbi:MAG: hypothetical protein ACLQDY_21295 [Streptosporangiaceae bacterium]